MQYHRRMQVQDSGSVARSDDEFYEKYHVRTDLALEATEVIVEREGPPEIPGVVVENEETQYGLINRTQVATEAGGRAIGKVPGNYVTIESPELRQHSRETHLEVSKLIAGELENFFSSLGLGDEDTVLVVGLGNWNATPDALGPRVIDKLLVTRHLFTLAPPEMRGGLRPVAAVAPGVLGITGIETGETVQGIVERIGPKMIICIDALASRSTERLCTTVQIADSGIHPGSGIGNMRLGITPSTMGVPVLAMGVPTVIHAVTLVSDGMDMISSAGNGRVEHETNLSSGAGKETVGPSLPSDTHGTIGTMLDPKQIRVTAGPNAAMEAGYLAEFSADTAANSRMQRLGRRLAAEGAPGIDQATKHQVIRKLLDPYMGTMVVTPKEIDVLMADAAWVVACGLNLALHPGMDSEQAAQYTL